MNQRLERLDGLAPFLQEPARQLIEWCESRLQRKLLVVSCWRSVQEQLLNYQKGRVFDRDEGVWEIEDSTLVVTNAKPGRTPHNVITRDGITASVALDVIPLLATGQADWNVGNAFWAALYELAWDVGLDPLGDQIGAYLRGDKGHFQEPGWRLKLDGLQLMLPTDEPREQQGPQRVKGTG